MNGCRSRINEHALTRQSVEFDLYRAVGDFRRGRAGDLDAHGEKSCANCDRTDRIHSVHRLPDQHDQPNRRSLRRAHSCLVEGGVRRVWKLRHGAYRSRDRRNYLSCDRRGHHDAAGCVPDIYGSSARYRRQHGHGTDDHSDRRWLLGDLVRSNMGRIRRDESAQRNDANIHRVPECHRRLAVFGSRIACYGGSDWREKREFQSRR